MNGSEKECGEIVLRVIAYGFIFLFSKSHHERNKIRKCVSETKPSPMSDLSYCLCSLVFICICVHLNCKSVRL